MPELRDEQGQEAVIGVSEGYWLEEADFVSTQGLTACCLGRLGFPRNWPAVYSQSKALKSLVGKKGRCPARTVGVVEAPRTALLQLQRKSGVETRPLQSFANAEQVETELGMPVVRGWAIHEHLDGATSAAFVAERYWWNALPDDEWVDFTPRPSEWRQLLLAEALDDAPKCRKHLSAETAEIAVELLQQRFRKTVQKPRRLPEPQVDSGKGTASTASLREALVNREEFAAWFAALRRKARPLARALPSSIGAEGSLVVCGPARFAKKRVENAGRAFHEKCKLQDTEVEVMPAKAGMVESKPAESSAVKSSASSSRRSCRSARSSQTVPPSSTRSRAVASHMSESLRGIDLYSLLGVEGSPPSIEDIKSAYRRKALTHHPDKQSSTQSKEFLLVQEAYHYLCEGRNLWAYDSSLPFDDTIPSEDEVTCGGFFQVLWPVFQRNAKWSECQPVPELGTADSSLDDVRNFYDFWHNFDSWRDVTPAYLAATGAELFDLNEAGGRDERRWMQKENEKLRSRFRAAEVKRLNFLVSLARRLDPRVPLLDAKKVKGSGLKHKESASTVGKARSKSHGRNKSVGNRGPKRAS